MKLFPNKKAVVLPLQDLCNADLHASQFTRSQVMRESKQIILPYDVPTMATLYDHGCNPDKVSPIQTEYSFKWEKDLPAFKHQVVTSCFITLMRRGFIFNDIGTGKTLSVLWAADYLQSLGLVHKVLIVCTLSTTFIIWAQTIFKSFPHRSYAMLYGTRDKRLREINKDVDYYILNHDGIKVLCDWDRNDDKHNLISSLFDDRPDIDMIIVDESAIFRKHTTDRSKALDWVCNKFDRRTWLMTGNPMPKEPTDIWAQARLVDRTLFPKYFGRFKQEVMHKVTQFKWVPNPGWQDVVYNRIGKNCIRFKRDDCIDLPPLVVEARECEMSTEQKKIYKKMCDEFCIEMRDKKITAANEGVKLNKLLQIACGCVYDRDSEAHAIECKPKLQMLFETVEESGDKIIIYTPFKHSIAMLEKALSKNWTVGVVNGDVSKKRRDEIFYQFQYQDLQIILAHPKAMAHGLDLTTAHTICWWSPVDDFEIYDQANGRITRPGQECKQTIVQLICSAVEKGIYRRNDAKEKMGGLLMSLLTEGV